MRVKRKEYEYTRWRILARRSGAYFLDLLMFALSGYLAFQLRFDGQVPVPYARFLWVAVVVWTLCHELAFYFARLDRGNWRFTSAHDVMRIVVATTFGSMVAAAVLVAAATVKGVLGVPHSVYVLDWLLVCLLATGARLLIRMWIMSERSNLNKAERKRTLIYGAGAAGLALLWELRQNQALGCNVLGFIDDDPSKARLVMQGKPVFGTGESLVEIVRKHEVQCVLIAMPSASGGQMVRVLQFVLEAGVEYKTVPGLADLITGAALGKQIRPVAVDDLLGRQPVQMDMEGIRAQIQGKVVLVTGAAGSIGSELCRQIARFNPKMLVGFEVGETPLFHLDRELRVTFPKLVFQPCIGDIRRMDDLKRAMETFKPEVVYHAAAYKHVPMMERNPFSGVENNIFGTWNVATAAAKAGVVDFVMISTDKAVKPSSLMGATKRVAELLVRALQKQHGTRFVSVRFGNVLGSNGSVIPIFKEQIAAGGPVMVTHPEITRYFMTIREASQLVLLAGSFGREGELFVLDMGEPVKIVELARTLIVLSGLRPDRDIQIQFSGLRPGEKLVEELNLEEEHLVPTSHHKIRSFSTTSEQEMGQIKNLLLELREIADARDTARLVLFLKGMVPDYNPGSELLKVALRLPEELVLESKQVARGVRAQMEHLENAVSAD